MAGLYVHVPFRRGPHAYDEQYAVDFDDSDVSQYEEALRCELHYYAQAYASEESITTAYVGGSRPSLLPLHAVHSILTTVVDVFDASTFEEATAEVNPADATAGYLHRLGRFGFDRLSLEVLSFFPEDLEALNAPHTAEDVVRSIQEARDTGFTNLSVDLLFGWPEQSLTRWKAVLRLAAELRLPHLAIVEASPSAGPVASEERRAEQLEFAMTFLQSEGYEQYELTHFALPGYRSAHQEQYYSHGNHLGLGPSAESFWWPHRNRKVVARRWTNVSDVDRYAALLRRRYPPVAYRRTLTQTALAREYILLRLRTFEGLDLDVLSEQYGVDLHASHSSLLARLRKEGLIHENDHRVQLTNRGRLLTDAITDRLQPSARGAQ